MIRLLERNDDCTISLTKFDKDDDVPPYAILSHRWEHEEVLFEDVMDGTAEGKAGFRKIQFCADQAWRDGLRHCWVDTCCIDKTNAVELQEAITSMFRWYHCATKCYVYLSDVSTLATATPFRDSLWFTRGWTLQELIAPESVEFFSREWVRLGDKISLEQDIHTITGIPISALRGAALSNFSVDTRMAWMDKRETTRPEDKAYALFGIFDVYMSLIYGEGRENALKRLRKAIAKDNAYLADLRLTDPRDDMRRISDTKGGLFRGASNWILEHEGFRKWCHSDDVRLLWIKGDPGKGKTMLLITIIEELDARPRAASSTVLSFFFCQGTDDKLNNAAAVLRGLIYLLCEKQPCLASHLHARYESAGAKLFEDANTFYALSNILEKIIDDDRLQQAYLVVDALDECVVDQDRLIRFIARHAATSRRVKWIVSSRNVSEVEDLLEISGPGCSDASEVKLSLEVTQDAEKVARAIEAFIDHKLSTVRSLRDEHDKRRQVRDALREKANGTFLWVALVVKELEKAKAWRALHVVEKMPSTLEAFYDQMMARARQSDEGDWEYCRLALSAATLAYRPLSLAELAVVSGLPPEISDNIGYVRDVVAMCGSFLAVKDGIIYLIHQSVKDYLAGRAATTIFPFGLHQAHRDMFVRSVEAMSVLRRNIYGLPHPGIVMEDVKVPNPDPLDKLQYSCIHWASHFCDVGHKRGLEKGDLEMMADFIRRSFLYWLEAVALLKSMSKSIASLRRLQTMLKEAQLRKSQHAILVADAVRFALHNPYILEGAPLQTYVSALLFSPASSLIRREFSRDEPLWVKHKPVVETSWSPCMQTLEGHDNWVTSVAFSADGEYIASGSMDTTIRIWDAQTGACIQTFEGHRTVVNSVTFSADGRHIASGSNDKTIKIWDAQTGACIQTLEGHKGWVNSVTFSADGRHIASGSADCTLKIWDMQTGTCIRTLEGHNGRVNSVAFSADDRNIASGSDDETIKIWDAQTGAYIQTLKGPSWRVTSIAFSTDGLHIVSGSVDDTIKIWDAHSGVCIQTLKGDTGMVKSVAFSADGRHIASGSDEKTIKLWDVQTGICIQKLEGHSSWVSSVAFSADGRHIASGSRDRTIRIWDAQTGVRTQTMEGHSSWVNSTTFAPDGRHIVSVSDDDTVKIWDAQTGACTQTLKDQGGVANSAAFSADGRHVASGSSNRTIKIWDVLTGSCIRTLEGHTSWIGSIVFSTDGRQIASGSGDKTIKIWNAQTGSCIRTLKGHSSWVRSAAFSADGRYIASGSGDKTIKVWDAQTGTCVQTLEGHSSWVGSVAFSVDGRYLASGSADNTVKILDAQTGVCEQTLEFRENMVDVVTLDTSEKPRIHVLTDRGWIVVHIGKGLGDHAIETQSQHAAQAMEETSSHWLGYGLSTCGRWIRWHDENVIWIPWDYRPTASAVWNGTGHTFASTSPSSPSISKVAIGRETGQVAVLGLAEPGLYSLV